MRAFIYGLHTGDYNYRYVGYTTKTDLRFRLVEHFQRAAAERKYKVSHWIRSHHYNIKIDVIEEIEASSAIDREKYWIAVLDTFHNGMNGTPGGEGHTGPKSAEHRKNISLALRGRKISDEARANISRGKQGAKWSDEAYVRVAEGNRTRQLGVARSEKTRSKISSTLRGRVVPDDQKERMRIGNSTRYLCKVCNRKFSPQWLGRHQKKTKHVGKIRCES